MPLKKLKRRGVLASDRILACRKVKPGKPYLTYKRVTVTLWNRQLSLITEI